MYIKKTGIDCLFGFINCCDCCATVGLVNPFDLQIILTL